jgi:hypothetical protein
MLARAPALLLLASLALPAAAQSPNPAARAIAPAPPALAVPTTSALSVLTGYDDHGAWSAALGCATTKLGFDSIASGTQITTQLAAQGIASVTGNSAQVSGPTTQWVTASSSLPFPMFQAGTLPSEPNFLSNDLSAPVYATGDIHFDFVSPVTAAGAFVADQAPLAGFAIEVFSGGTSLGTISVGPRTLPSSFVGVVSTIPFDAATFFALSAFDSWGLDDVEFCSGGAKIYCTAKVNSQGCAPAIAAAGIPSASSGSGFHVTASQVLSGKFGLLFYGKNGPAAFPFQGGILCSQPPLVRTKLQNSGGSGPCDGAYDVDFNAWVASGADPGLVAGQQVNAQYWSRDPGFAPPNNTSLSDAVEFTLAP